MFAKSRPCTGSAGDQRDGDGEEEKEKRRREGGKWRARVRRERLGARFKPWGEGSRWRRGPRRAVAVPSPFGVVAVTKDGVGPSVSEREREERARLGCWLLAGVVGGWAGCWAGLAASPSPFLFLFF